MLSTVNVLSMGITVTSVRPVTPIKPAAMKVFISIDWKSRGCSLLNHFLLHALVLVWIFWYFFTSACHSRFFSDTEVSIWQFGLHSVTLLFSLGFSWVMHTCKADLDCSQKLAQRTLSTGKHRTVKQAADLRIRRGIEHLCYDELALHALRWMC